MKSVQQSSAEKISLKSAFIKIVETDGWRGLYIGMTGRLQRVSLGVVVLSLVNDKVQHTLQLRRFHADLALQRRESDF